MPCVVRRIYTGAVRGALDAGCDLIILGGGDGTVSAAVDLLAHRRAVLGLLPLGTANVFARTLGIPDDLEGACATIARGKVVDIDLGRADDLYYVNVASIGLGARVITRVSPWLKRVAGSLAYPVAAVRALVGFRPFAATLTFPGSDHAPATFPRLLQIGVGNGRFYDGGAVVAPDAGIDDGTLDVYAIEWAGWRGLAGLAVAPTVAHVDVPLLLAATLLVTLLFRQPSLHRRTGVALLILYVAYIVYALVRGAV